MNRRCFAISLLPLVAVAAAGCSGHFQPTQAYGGGGGGTTPSIASINGAAQPGGPIGSTVVIRGANFGVTAGTVLFATVGGGTAAATIATTGDWTDALIVTTVPAGAVTGGVTVTVGTQVSTAVSFTVTAVPAFTPASVAWTAATSLPVGLSGLAAASATVPADTAFPAVWIVGGADSTGAPTTGVRYAKPGATGSLGGWAAAAPLPIPLAFLRVVAATPTNSMVAGPGYLYALGGITTGDSVSTAIYRGTLTTTGSVSGWAVVRALPKPLHSFGAALVFGSLYVFGGATTGHAPAASVYRTAINADGSLGAWQTLTALPFARAYAAFGRYGDYLYAFGGDSGTVAPDSAATTSAVADVAYARVDPRTGNVASSGWVLNGNALPSSFAKGTAVLAGGSVLVTAGLYPTASTGGAEDRYATLNTNGSLGVFTVATGTPTLASLEGNLFNHAAVGYYDTAGDFHVLVAGGDDVNTPGTKHRGVYYY